MRHRRPDCTRHPASSLSLPVSLALAVFCGGCADRGLEWSYSFPSRSLRNQTALLEAQVAPGSCDAGPGAIPEFVSEFRTGEQAPSDFPALPPGRWAFSIAGRSADCVPVVAGCVSLELPIEEPAVPSPIDEEPGIVVRLDDARPDDGASVCPGRCDGAGGCRRE